MLKDCDFYATIRVHTRSGSVVPELVLNEAGGEGILRKDTVIKISNNGCLGFAVHPIIILHSYYLRLEWVCLASQYSSCEVNKTKPEQTNKCLVLGQLNLCFL